MFDVRRSLIARRSFIAGAATALLLGIVIVAPMATAATPRHDADQTPATPDWLPTYNRMIAEIMSPYCHGLTLDNCPTQGAAELRDEIRAWLIAGRSEDEILDELELRFGPSILGAPRMRGIGILAWAVPPLVFAVGALGLAIFLKRNTAPAKENERPD